MDELKKELWTAEKLAAEFGDQAYHKGIRLALEALRNGDQQQCCALGIANVELLRLGYGNYVPRREA